MDERNKDLPLVVSEILIEMHELKTEMQAMRRDFKEYQADNSRMFQVLMDENRKNAEFMIYSLNRIVGTQQERINEHEQRLQRLEQQGAQPNS